MASLKYLNKVTNLIKGYKSVKHFQRIAGDCRVVSADEGRVKVEFEVVEKQTNPFGTLHGGCTATLVDIVTTVAVMATEQGQPGVSVDLSVSYLAPAKVGETVVLDAFVTKMGKSLCFTRAELYRKNDNVLVATASHTKAFPSYSKL